MTFGRHLCDVRDGLTIWDGMSGMKMMTICNYSCVETMKSCCLKNAKRISTLFCPGRMMTKMTNAFLSD